MICPYCNTKARWTENKEVYGKNYGKSYMIWLCDKCNAYVGCHKNSKEPLGSMANRELRQLRKEVHEIIDPFWRDGTMEIKEVYSILSEFYGHEVHIGAADKALCIDIIKKAEIIFESID